MAGEKSLFLDTVNDGITVHVGDVKLHVETPDKKKKDKMVNTVVKQAMEQAGLELSDIDSYKVVTGPGSWTGARVGVAVIKAYCMAHDRPVMALPEGKIMRGSELEPTYDREFIVTLPKTKPRHE